MTKMAIDKLIPNDTRVQYSSAQIRGKSYGYMLGEPQGQPLDTILLMHGFPDLGFGWRYQIPHLMSLGYRVIVPDMIGFGRTDAPMALEAYSHASVAEDMKELLKQIMGESQQVIIGGHDWGGCIVWDMAQRYPQLVKAVFSVCTPIPEPEDTYVPLEDDIAAGKQTNFKYKLQFKGFELESHVQGSEKLHQFFNAAYDGKTAAGEHGVSADNGIILDKLPLMKQSELVSEDEVAYYAAQYMSHEAPQLRGPLNWYRVDKLNWESEIDLKGMEKTR
jgi:pimeloyl-ACP methyl ester carboxylesterase